MEKWPQVPAVYGWLRLSRRGQWFLIDRSSPDFDETRDGDGSLISSPPILDFIGRNYECDERGAWYWQNGPQRAFVRIELAPLVLRVLNEPPAQRLVTHTGHLVERVERVLADADGNLLMVTDLGPAVVDDRDIGQLQIASVDETGDADAADPSDGAGDRRNAARDGDADTAGTGPELQLAMERYPAPDGTVWRFRAQPLSGSKRLGQLLGFVAEPAPPAAAA